MNEVDAVELPYLEESIMAFLATIEGDELVIRIPLNAKPERSASGKTLVVASTHGNKETDCVIDGKKVTVGVNAYISLK